MKTIKMRSVFSLAIILFTRILSFSQGTCASPYNLGTIGSSTVCSGMMANGTTGSAPCAGAGYGGSGGVTYVKFCTGASTTCINFNITQGTASGNFAVTVYSANCTTVMDAQCLGNSGTGATFNTASPSTNAYQPNSCYIARIWSGNAGSFNICANTIAPANDFCNGASPINQTPQSFNNYCMTAGSNGSYTEPSAAQFCAGSLENNAWYAIQTLSTCSFPCTVTVTIAGIVCSGGGAGFQIGFWTGACSSMTNIGCTSGSGGTVTATITNLNPSQTVLIGIDGNAGANCSYSMSATNTIPLPITMMNFDLYKNTKGVTAQWSTASEKNNQYFVLEKTNDGINFTEVGRIDGAGTSSAMHNYSFTDESPVYGISYYRIKQVDTDGTYSYSQMRAIDFKELAVSNFELIPNPSESQSGVILSFNESAMADLDINIYNISGTLLYSKTEQVKGNKIELPKFEKGFYIVQVTGPNFNKTKRMIVK